MNTKTASVIALLLALSTLPSPAQTPKLDASVSWIGNSFSGKTAWTLQDVDDICVLPDGTLFTNVGWDEGGANVQEYNRAGEVVAVAEHTHGWGYGGGQAVAANAKYLFIAQQIENEGGGLKGDFWPAKGLNWSGVSRRLRRDIQKPAPFDGGKGGDGDTLKDAFLPIMEYPEGTDDTIHGLCATETALYACCPHDSTVKIYDTETMHLTKTWSVPRPQRICRDRSGTFWILQRPAQPTQTWRILHLSGDGETLSQQIKLTNSPTSGPNILRPQDGGWGAEAGSMRSGPVLPTSLCIDSQNRLLIADAGPDNQIRIYDHLDGTPHLAGTFGVRGGIFAKPEGAFGDRRLNHPSAVGADASGRIYVASDGQTFGGGTVLECYGPDGKPQWQRFGLLFVDCPAADPRHPEDVYTKEEHFTADYSRPAGSDWNYRGYTVNPYKYPDDPRLHLASTNARIEILGGCRFLFVSDMTGENLHVYRFAPKTDGETAIPCALFAKRHRDDKTGYPAGQPTRGEWLWTDNDADGKIDTGEYQTNGDADSGGLMTPDDTGAIWQAWGTTIRELPFQKVDARGIPHWDYSKAKTFSKPAEFDEIRRLRYLPDKDIMVLGGNKGNDHNQHWKPMGPVLCLYDHWRSGTPTLRKSIVLPYEKGASGHFSVEPISFDVAGDYIFVAYTRGLEADGLTNAFVKVLRLSDLSIAGNLSAEADFGETGLLDLVESTTAVRRSNGEYVVFLEDDAKAKSIVFRWKP